jgi:hypothetical protein
MMHGLLVSLGILLVATKSLDHAFSAPIMVKFFKSEYNLYSLEVSCRRWVLVSQIQHPAKELHWLIYRHSPSLAIDSALCHRMG